MKLKIGFAGLWVLVAACTSAEPPEERVPRADGVFEPLVGTVDRARGVQQTVDDQAAELRRRIEEEER